MAKFCPKCGKPVADESAKFCSNCGLKLPDSSVIENDQNRSGSIPAISPQTELPVPLQPIKKRSTLEWVILICVGAVLVVAALAILSILFLTPVSTITTNSSDKNVQSLVTPESPASVPLVVSTPYIDPFPNALPLNSAYHIENTPNNLRYPPEQYPNQPASTKNDVSIQIKRVALWDSYTVQTPTKYQTVGPSAGKKFVIVIVEVTNYAGNAIIISPYPSNFELLYDGSHFLPTEIEYPVQAASISYTSESIGRNEQTGGTLVYEVPSSLTLNQSYIRLIYLENDGKNPVWHLK
jgi:hypothetical protein